MPPVARPVFWDSHGCKHSYISPKTWKMLAGFEDSEEIECPAA